MRQLVYKALLEWNASVTRSEKARRAALFFGLGPQRVLDIFDGAIVGAPADPEAFG